MGWQKKSNYYSGQGVILLGDLDANGNGVNFIPVGNVSDLTVDIATSVTEHKESQSGARGIDLRLTTEVKANLSMTLESFDADNMALALRGGSTNVAGSTVTGVAGKVALGMIMALKHIGVSALTIKKGATTLIEFVAGTATAADGQWDYKVNADSGSIMWAKVPKTAALVTGDDVTSDYTFASQVRVDALTTAAQEKYVRFEGLNTADDNKPVVVEVFRFLTDPLKKLDLIGNAVGQMPISGSILQDANKAAPDSQYFRETMLA